MRMKHSMATASTILLTAWAMICPAQAPGDGAPADSRHEAPTAAQPVAEAIAAHMVVVKGKDVSGHVFKRLGLPNHEYCQDQCLKDERCTGTRWGVLEGDTAGQCQLLSDALTLVEPRKLKTSDGQAIVVIASRKEAAGSKRKIGLQE